jgi:adenylosuccinate synthase
MTGRIILLSGAVSSGKSTLSKSLAASEGALVFRTPEVLQKNVASEMALDRKALQAEGERLDLETQHRWVLEEFQRWRSGVDKSRLSVVDSVRTLGQVQSFREEFGPIVVHVHLTAPEGQLNERYNKRPQLGPRAYSFADVRSNPTEKGIESLTLVADLVVNTIRCTEADVLTRTDSHLGVRHNAGRGYVDVVVGGQYFQAALGLGVGTLAFGERYLAISPTTTSTGRVASTSIPNSKRVDFA